VLGASALFEILKEHKDYQNKCIITINHNTDIDDEYFDKIYEVDKENGFSRITKVN
jgi:ABC-type phosphate/phosphonate transport system ATPase subunit